MSDANVTILGQTSRNLPQPKPDNVESGPARLSKYDEQYSLSLIPTKHLIADEGSYFVAGNPTPGTGIAMTISTAFADTVAMFAIRNNDNPSNPASKRIYLDYIRLILLGTPPTGQVSRQFAFKRSKATDREPTTAANRTELKAVNVAGAAGRASIGRYLSYSAAAAMTVPASSNADEVVGRCSIPTGIGIAGDEYIVKFGTDAGESVQGLTAAKAVVPGRYVTHAAPLIIEPGEWLVVHEWCPTEATNGPTFEFEIGAWER
jgi:hypothetical protein